MKFSSEKTVAVKFEKRKKGGEPHLQLQAGRIQVRESTQYLGLVVDKRLNWRDHVDHLRAKCTSPVNIIKHLSHLSWGADRKTLQRLYVTKHSFDPNWITVLKYTGLLVQAHLVVLNQYKMLASKP